MTAAGAIAGVLSISGFVLYLTPGPLFAIAVMIPFRGLVGGWWYRMIGAVVLCLIGFMTALAVMVRLADTAPAMVAYGAAGGIGALIAGKCLLIMIGYPWRYRVLAWMAVAGFLTGAIFGMSMYVSFPWFGFIVWQAATAAPLGSLLGELRDDSSNGP